MSFAFAQRIIGILFVVFVCNMQAKSLEDRLFQAIKDRDVKSVKTFADRGAYIKNDMVKATLIYLLAVKKLPNYQQQKNAAQEIIKILVAHGAQPTVRDYIMAASENMVDLVRDWTYLPDGSFAFEAEVQDALNAAAAYKAYDVARYLLDQGVSPNAQGDSYPLEMAVVAYYGLQKPTKLEFIKFLLEHGAVVSARVQQEAQGIKWKYPEQLRPGATREKVNALETLLAKYQNQ